MALQPSPSGALTTDPTSTGRLNAPSNQYLLRNREAWQELERLVARARKKGPAKLSPEELDRLDRLYRHVTVHLARTASRGDDPVLAGYLNDLAAAAHGVIYAPPRRRPIQGVLTFLITGFPRTVARMGVYHGLAAIIFFAGAVLGFLAPHVDPIAAYAILPAQEVRLPGTPRAELLEHLRSGRDHGGDEKFLFASFLFQHNLSVGILSFAVGILAAAPTALLILYNGMILGTFTFIHTSKGIHAEYWAWILPHAVPELTAIILCGGAGLALGAAVINPGRGDRMRRLAETGRDAVKVFLGVGALLVAAAIIESYLRQSHMETWARLAVAGTLFALLAGYFAVGFVLERRGRQTKRASPGSPLNARPAPSRTFPSGPEQSRAISS